MIGIQQHSLPRAFTFVTIILLGLNLRPIMASVGPLLDTMQASVGVSDIQASLLTTLPVLAMGIFALLGSQLQRRLGVLPALSIAILLIGVACVARWPFHAASGLLLTAALGGIGIAIIQALLPGLIKHELGSAAGRAMALFTTGIMGGAALSSATVSPLSAIIDWNGALAIWGLLALLAAIAWSVLKRRIEPANSTVSYSLPWTSRRAWFLMFFFGIGTSAYTLILAWLPPFYTQLGWSASASGMLLGGLTLCQVVSGLTLSSMIHRFPDRRRLLASILLLAALGLVLLAAAPDAMAMPVIVVLGLAIGGLFPLSLIVALDHLEYAEAAGALMGFVQGGGYIIASAMPFVAGFIREAASSLSSAWLLMALGLLIQLAMVPFLAPGDRLEPNDWRLVRE